MEQELSLPSTLKTSQRKKLETKGCCFFCLTVTEFKAEVDGSNHSSVTRSNKETVNLKSLQRYLQLNTKRGDENGRRIDEIIEADLCKSCGKIFNNFSKLFTSLEKIEIEIQYWLERIQQQISAASKKSELVQIYSKRMTSDVKALGQLVFVDNLRKEIAKKSSKTKWSLNPTVELSRLDKSEIEKYFRKRKTEPELSFPAGHNQSDAEDEEYVFEDNYSLTWDNDDESDNSEANLPEPVSAQSGYRSDDKIIIKQNIQPNAKHNYKILNRRQNCDKCGSVFASKESLKEHLRKCDGTKRPRQAMQQQLYSFFDAKTRKFNCRKCKKAFWSSSGAANHYLAAHLPAKFKCASCSLVFTRQASLSRHQKTCKSRIQNKLANGEQNAHTCPTCGKGFAQKSNMEIHRKAVHLKQKNYACDLCEEKFCYLNILKEHKNKIHFGVLFNCKYCEKRFGRKENLIRHQQICAKSVKLEPAMDTLPH